MVSYLTPTKDHWACDIEADDLLPKVSRIWCVCVINCVTKERKTFTDAESFNNFQREHPDAIYVGHNFTAYDLVVLNRFWRANIPIRKVVDTFVLSQLFNPTYSGGHSLAAWGERLKFPKTKHSDFSQLTPEMLKYCMNDTILTAYLFRKLTERMRSIGFTERGAEIEHLAWHIIQNKQRRNGFPLDKQRAEELYASLRAREEELKSDIYKLWPPTFQVVGSFKNARKKDGTFSVNFNRHREQYPELRIRDNGDYDAYDWVSFNLGSPSQRVAKLLELGWVPVTFTPKTKKGGGGNPKVDEDSLLNFAEVSGNPEAKALSKWIVINSRANMIRTWLDAYNEETGAVHGELWLASTLRYRHANPNTANIPAVRFLKVDGEDQIQYGEDGGYSYESRDLWTSGGPEWTLVGIDGTGIQNRCLIHWLIDTVGEEAVAEFKQLSLEGDIHKRNIEVLELPHKAAAKKFYYTLMMGGGGARLAADQVQFGVKMTEKEGEAKKRALIKSMPGFGDVIKRKKKELDATGRITLCDGTPIIVSSPHMVIPYLLQGDESRLMKQALIFLDEGLRRAKLSEVCLKVADIHDEWQWRVRNEYVTQFCEMALPCFTRAGESFNYHIPIAGDFKIGRTWAETH